MDIVVLSSGCPTCSAQFEQAQKLVEELNLDATVKKEEDMVQILNYGAMSLPTLVIDGKVVSSGKVLSHDQMRDLMLAAQK